MSDLLARITSEPGKLGGRPCLRGLRILPGLEPDDVKAALAFAAKRVDHPLIAAE